MYKQCNTRLEKMQIASFGDAPALTEGFVLYQPPEGLPAMHYSINVRFNESPFFPDAPNNVLQRVAQKTGRAAGGSVAVYFSHLFGGHGWYGDAIFGPEQHVLLPCYPISRP
jgi:hypothetical protein